MKYTPIYSKVLKAQFKLDENEIRDAIIAYIKDHFDEWGDGFDFERFDFDVSDGKLIIIMTMVRDEK